MIFSRRVRKMGLVSGTMLLFAAYGIYRAADDYHSDYKIFREHNISYMVDKSSDKSYRIYETPYGPMLGTPKRNLELILKQKTDDIKNALEEFAKKYSVVEPQKP